MQARRLLDDEEPSSIAALEKVSKARHGEEDPHCRSVITYSRYISPTLAVVKVIKSDNSAAAWPQEGTSERSCLGRFGIGFPEVDEYGMRRHI